MRRRHVTHQFAVSARSVYYDRELDDNYTLFSPVNSRCNNFTSLTDKTSCSSGT